MILKRCVHLWTPGIKPMFGCNCYFVLGGASVQYTQGGEIDSDSTEARTFIFTVQIPSKWSIPMYLLIN